MDPATPTAPAPAAAGNGAAPDGVQPTGAENGQPGGQGGVDEGSGLYDLSSVPPELVQYVEPELKKMEANVTKKFQEAAEYRQQWEPFEQLGIADYAPEDIDQLLKFGQVLTNPETVTQLVEDQDQFEGWWEKVGETMGFFGPDDGGQGEGEGGQNGQPSQEVLELRQEVEELRAALDPLQEHARTTELSQRQQEVDAEIDKRLEAVKAANPGVEFSDEVEEAVLTFALKYDGDDDIERGFADYMKLTGGAQRELVDAAGGVPRAPEGPGSPQARDEGPRTFADAKEQAKRRLAATP